MNFATEPTTTDQIRVYLFGRVRVEVEDDEIDLPTRKSEFLLAYLILHPGPQSREKVAAVFWGDSPDSSARASLRNALAVLRRHLDPALFISDRNTLQLNPDYPLWVDVLQFRFQARRYLDAPSSNPEVDLDLHGDDLLIDCYDDWAVPERETLRALLLDCLLDLAQQRRSTGDYESAIAFASRALETDATNERAHQHLMFCQVALGRREVALRQYERCREELWEELGIEPSPATERLHDWIENAPSERTPLAASVTNLPIPATSFVGRAPEMTRVRDLIASERMVTLTGPGGIGKTRMAIQVATDDLDVFSDGVWWVDLSSVTNEDQLTRAVSNALAVPEVPGQPTSETLANFVYSKDLLVVLDNCEHLIEACADLTHLILSKSPNVKILTTSREPLGTEGEHVWRMAGLPVPRLDESYDMDDLAQFGSLELFMTRASALDASFTLSPDDVPAAVKVCAHLEGVPLAIELAAARVATLGIAEVAERLEESWKVLTTVKKGSSPRHRTLNATIDWSHELLSSQEQTLFRRLSVFEDGWTLEAAETVCAGEGLDGESVVGLLARLAEKSLVERSSTDVTRFRFLRTIKQYAAERLIEADEVAPTRDRHFSYFRRYARRADPHLGYFVSDHRADTWLSRLVTDHENLRLAIEWGLDSRTQSSARLEESLDMAANLHWFWFARGRFVEGGSWLRRLLDASRGRATSAHRALGLLTAGYLSCWTGEFDSGRPDLEEALATFRELDDPHGVSFALHGLGFVALGQGEAEASFSLFEQALRGAEELGDKWLASFADHFLGIVLTYAGEFEKASSLFDEGNALLDEMGGHRQGLAFSLFHHGRIARLLGEYPAARSRQKKAMLLFEESGDIRGIAYSLSGFALLAAAQSDFVRAAKLSGALDSIETVLGSFLEAPLQIEFDQQMAAVRTAMGEDAFARASAEGFELTPELAIAFALETTHPA